VEHGADINKTNENGETPLFYACRYGNEIIVIHSFLVMGWN